MKIAIEELLKELLQHFLLITEDCDDIIKALGLDFDPKEELKKRQAELTEKPIKTDTENLDRISTREEIKT